MGTVLHSRTGSLAIGCVSLLIFSACSPSSKPPPIRDLEVSVAFSWTDGPQRRPGGVEVGAMPIEKAKPSIRSAIIRRDSVVNNAWIEKKKRQKEIERLKQDFAILGVASAPPRASAPESKLRNAVEACRDTLNSVADTAVLYLEDVKQKLGPGLEKEKLERFRKNLGAEELRDLALSIKAEGTPEVRKALGDARTILGREVWTGKAADKEHALGVISELEAALAEAKPSPKQTADESKSPDELKARIVAVVRDQMNWDNELALANRSIHMYTALADAEVHAKTDGDGKCHLILPREGRWVVFAYVEKPMPAGMTEKQQSLMIAEKEELIWILEAPGDGSERASITLSEENALHAGVAPLKMDLRNE